MLIEIDEILSTKITKQTLKQTYEDIEKEIQDYRVGSRVPLTEIQQEDLAQLLKMQNNFRLRNQILKTLHIFFLLL